MDEFAEVLAAFKRDIGLDQGDDIQNPFEVTVDEVPVTVSGEIRVGEPRVVLYAPLGRVEEAEELAVYRLLLDANVLWKVSNDCTLGVKAETRQAFLCFHLGVPDVARRSLADVVRIFVEEAKRWIDALAAARAEGSARSALTGGVPDILVIQA